MPNEQYDDAVDVSGSPELRRLVEAVRRTGKAIALRDGKTTLAVVVPFSRGRPQRGQRRQPTAQDDTAFRSAAGSWSDVDIDRFLEDIYAARDVPDERPPVEL